MPEYTSWEESRGRIEDRFERMEASLTKISGNIEKLVWLLVTAIVGLAGHALSSRTYRCPPSRR